MPYFYDPITKRKSEISSPELNPELIKGKTQIPGTEIITSEDLNSVNKIDFFLPMEVSAYPVAGLNTQTGQAEILPKEQEQSDIIKRTQALIDQFTGKETLRAEKEIELGIPEFKKTQQDLASRLKIIQAEAQAIPLQLQQEAKGRGITTGGLAPIEAGRLRANAIQALSVSSLLEASRGNLTTALDLADRAVAQKYNPIEAQINANLQNLELLSKDPTLTLAQKNRLEAQQRIQEQRKVKIELTKKNEEEARKKVLNYAGIADALTLNEMSKAQTALEVVQIAERKGLTLKKPDLLSVSEAKALGVPFGTTREEAFGIKPKISEVPIIPTFLDSTSSTYLNDLFSSNIGGKKPTQVETLRPIQKTMAVINQLGELSSLIKNTTTDPILGTLRSMNPYDFDARAIQATLQATVPNLARGVYGEVGVLTDQDIKNYIQTLPNIKSTESQNKFVMGMTLRSLQSGLLGQLEVLQGAGYDISGFKNLYDKLVNQTNKIEKELGMDKLKEIAPEKTVIFDEIIKKPSSVGGYFSNLWKAIKGL